MPTVTKPTRRQRRRAHHAKQVQAATTGDARLAAEWASLRAALADVDKAKADRIANHAADDLHRLAEQLRKGPSW